MLTQQMIFAQNSRMEPFSRAKALAEGDKEYLLVLTAKLEAITAYNLDFSATTAIVDGALKKNVAPRNGVSIITTAKKTRSAMIEALKYSGTEQYLVSPSNFHRYNKDAINSIECATKATKVVCTAFKEAIKLDEETTNEGIAAYNATKYAGLSDAVAHNAACDAKYKTKNLFSRIINRMIVRKSFWTSMEGIAK